MLSGIIDAVKLASVALGRPLADYRIPFLAGRCAAIGATMQLESFFRLWGLSDNEACEGI